MFTESSFVIVRKEVPAIISANVYIDGTLAGVWMEPWNNPDSRWLDDPFDNYLAGIDYLLLTKTN